MLLHPQRASLIWSAEKDVLKKRMADNEAENVVSMLTWTRFFDQHQPSNIPRSLFFLLLLQRLLAKLTNKEKELSKLAEHLDFEKVWTTRLVLPEWKDNTAGIFVPSLSHSNMHLFKVCLFQIKKNLLLALYCPQQEKTKTTEELSRILQSTRDHLESELNRMEDEKAHLAAQIQVCGREIQQNTLLAIRCAPLAFIQLAVRGNSCQGGQEKSGQLTIHFV